MKTYNQYHNNLKEQKELMKPLLKFTKKHIKSRDLITLSSFPEVQDLKKYRQEKKGGSAWNKKPNGIWFGIGDSWINWIESDSPKWAKPSVIKIELNLSKILNLRKDSDLRDFEERYLYMERSMYSADWRRVALTYDGIIHWMHPYGGRFLLDDPRSFWYGWDVRSGCVWNPAAIKSIKIIGRYDEDKKEYVRM